MTGGERTIGRQRKLFLLVAATALCGLGSAAAQTASCTTLGTPGCCPTFGDPTGGPGGFSSDAFRHAAQTALRYGVMVGCGGDLFCPQDVVTRGDMADFLENAKHLGQTVQLTPTLSGFADVPATFPLACWIYQLYTDNITAGCGGGNYCPNSPVTRAQMAVFLLKTKLGSTYVPPACTGIFNDVPCPLGFAVNWIEDLYNRGIAAGCGGGNYCPNNSVTREQMGVFLKNTFLVGYPGC